MYAMFHGLLNKANQIKSKGWPKYIFFKLEKEGTYMTCN